MGAPATYALQSLQTLMASTLAADDMFCGNQSANGQPVPIITEQLGDLVTQFEAAIGKMGICLVVMTPLFEFTNYLAPSLDGEALVSVNVFENVTLNQGLGGTMIPASSAAERITARMHHCPIGEPQTENNPSKFIGVQRPLEMNIDPTGLLLNYTCLFQAHITLSTPQP